MGAIFDIKKTKTKCLRMKFKKLKKLKKKPITIKRMRIKFDIKIQLNQIMRDEIELKKQ